MRKNGCSLRFLAKTDQKDPPAEKILLPHWENARKQLTFSGEGVILRITMRNVSHTQNSFGKDWYALCIVS